MTYHRFFIPPNQRTVTSEYVQSIREQLIADIWQGEFIHSAYLRNPKNQDKIRWLNGHIFKCTDGTSRKISKEELRENFFALVRSESKAAALKLYYRNTELRRWLSGDTTQQTKTSISEAESILLMNDLIAYHHYNLIAPVVDNNSYMKTYLREQLTLEEAITLLNEALDHSIERLANRLWKYSNPLKNWFNKAATPEQVFYYLQRFSNIRCETIIKTLCSLIPQPEVFLDVMPEEQFCTLMNNLMIRNIKIKSLMHLLRNSKNYRGMDLILANSKAIKEDYLLFIQQIRQTEETNPTNSPLPNLIETFKQFLEFESPDFAERLLLDHRNLNTWASGMEVQEDQQVYSGCDYVESLEILNRLTQLGHQRLLDYFIEINPFADALCNQATSNIVSPGL